MSAQWRWVDFDGEQVSLSTDELRAALQASSLPEYVLVWQAGWAEWLHARSVADLADALPVGKRGIAMRPRTFGNPSEPPAPRLGMYRKFAKDFETRAPLRDALTAAAPNAPLPATPPPPEPTAPAPAPAAPPPPTPTAPVEQQAAPTPEPPIAPSGRRSTVPPETPGPIAIKRTPGPALGDVPVPVPREPQPTLAGVDIALATPGETLRPAAAVPPPPKALPASMPDGVPQTLELPNTGRRRGRLTDPEEPTLADPLAEADPPKPASPLAVLESTPARIAVLVVLAIAAFSLSQLLFGTDEPETTLAVPSTQAASSPPQGAPTAEEKPAPPSCLITKSAQKLADSAYPAVPLTTATSGAGNIALGYAGTAHQALGVVVKTSTLTVDPLFNEQFQARVMGVVPHVTKDNVSFSVDLAKDDAKTTRTLAPGLRIAHLDAGIARLEPAGGPAILWPLEAGIQVTTPRATELVQDRYGVTARVGGKQGKIHLGWLGKRGEQQGPFSALPLERVALGTPGVTNSNQEALVTFVAKSEADSPWQLHLAKAKPGAHPNKVKMWSSDIDRISPAAAPLRAGHWLLQWSEGKSGSRTMLGQVVSETLEPLHEPLRLSPFGIDAGQGSLWLKNGLALSLFLVRTGAGFELWGTSLSCK